MSTHWIKCQWCGQVFWGRHDKKFCSDKCWVEMLDMKAKMKQSVRNVKTDDVIAVHLQEEQAKQSLAERNTKLSRKILVPVHHTSNGVRWEWKER